MNSNIVIDGQIDLHAESTFEYPVKLMAGISNRAPISVGAFSYSYSLLSPFVMSIGRYCSIASGIVFGEMEHATSWATTSNVSYDPAFWDRDYSPKRLAGEKRRLGITIGNDVWIGAKCFIRGGVVIGDGAVIGFGAIVTKDVPPFAVVVGNPGRIVKYRFDQNIRDRILAAPWWRYDVTEFADYLDDPIALLDEIDRVKPDVLVPEQISGAQYLAARIHPAP